MLLTSSEEQRDTSKNLDIPLYTQVDYSEILEDCEKIISSYKPNFHDSFGKNAKIYEQARIIKFLILKIESDV